MDGTKIPFITGRKLAHRQRKFRWLPIILALDWLLNGDEAAKEVATPSYATLYRIDLSDLSEDEKDEFEKEMEMMSQFVANRIRAKKGE